MQINEEEEALLPAIVAGVAPGAVNSAPEEQDIDDDTVPILQQVLFEATLVGALFHTRWSISDHHLHTAALWCSIRLHSQQNGSACKWCRCSI